MAHLCPSDVTARSSLSGLWAEMSLDAFASPDRKMERLYELAVRDPWRVEDMDWDALEMHRVPKSLRQAAAHMFAQTHYGELAALLASARLVDLRPGLPARIFCSTQVNDEARHVRWFGRLMHELDCRGEVSEPIAGLMTEVCESETPEEVILGMQLMVEGLAQ